MSAPGGLLPGGVSAVGGPAPGGCLLPGGMPTSGPGGCIPACNGGRPPCEQNDRQVQKYYLAPNFFCGR